MSLNEKLEEFLAALERSVLGIHKYPVSAGSAGHPQRTVILPVPAPC